MQAAWVAAGRRAALVSLIALGACSRWAEPLRYGSLQQDDGRTFHFEHGLQVFKAANGMRFAILRDTRTNLATVDLRYDVGAKDDPPGRAGLAHLVEHLMFELRPAPGAPPLAADLEAVALTSNAFTSWDGTHYTATVPAAAIARLIAIEGRRMAATCEQLDDATIARERDVVLAENAQTADRAVVYDLVSRAIYGDDHPYARPISTDEIAGATRAEICGFIAEHYVPARASLVITGAVDVDRVAKLTGAVFGGFARRAPRPPLHPSPPTLRGEIAIRAPIDEPTALVAFAAPPFGSRGVAAAQVARALLAEALADADRDNDWIIGTDVVEIGDDRAPTTVAVVTVRRPEELGAAADEVFAQARALFEVGGRDSGRLRTRMALDYMQQWDDVASRGPWIARFLQYADHERFMLDELAGVARPWGELRRELTDAFTPPRARQVLITPSATAGARTAGVVAAVAHAEHVWRRPVDPAEADRPVPLPDDAAPIAVARYQLANGLTVELAPDPSAAIVDARLVYPVGRAHADAAAPMVPDAAAWLLDFDAEGWIDNRAEYDRMMWALDVDTMQDARVDSTSTTFQVQGLANYADWHVWRLSALLDRGRYNQVALDALHRVARAIDDDEVKADARRATIERTFRERLFGAGHPLAAPARRLGPALAAVTAGQLTAWKRAHYRPRGATLIISGKFDEAAMRREVDELFAPWADAAPAPLPAMPPVQPAPTASWLAVEDRDALQVAATVAFPLAPTADRGPARQIAEAILDDQMRDVREQLGASYGIAAGHLGSVTTGGALVVGGRLAPPLAGAGVARMLAIIDELRSDPAVVRAAFVRARRALVARLTARTAGASAIADERERAAAAGVTAALDRVQAAAVASATLAEVTEVLMHDLDPDRMVVRLVGRAPAVDAAFVALGREPEWFLEPAPTHPPRAPTPRPAAPTPPPVDDGPPVEALSVDRWDEEGERHDGLYQGQARLSLDAFLAVAGRDDLRDRMRRRWWLRVGLAAAGAATIGGGLLYLLDARSCDDVVELPTPGRELDKCIAERDGQRTTGSLVMLGGAVLEIAAYYISNQAPTKAELRQAASRYNYRHRLRGAAAAHDLRIRPTTDGQTTGLTVSGSF
ncbi:MAG: insulinase family protein [Myxococcales bacterium]|nr:insulinase family protein [Myxococcales bacterium]